MLVIGPNSKIGSELVRLLRARDKDVRVLVRAAESGAGFAAEGVDVAVGDLGDRASLGRAMTGVESVFLLSSPAEETVAWHRNAIDAARAAGVRHVVRSSILGADPSSPARFVRDHGHADAYLRESGLAYTIVRPNYFSQNVVGTAQSLDEQGNFYGGTGDARVSMVDTRDVAAVAAMALTEPGHERAEYDVTGPEALTNSDDAAKLSSALGRPVRYVDVPDKATRETLAGYGLSEWLVDAIVELVQDYRASGADGYVSRVTDDVEDVTGRRPRTLDELLAESRPSLVPA